ncbi:MAG TPA: cytochrome c1 [Burkholderiaceae bacterium]|nr:cytochrome c1 [Burkholderiaceae bacterium]
MIKKLLGAIAITLLCTVSAGADEAAKVTPAPDRINNLPALQNGAKLFVNYCLSCHSAKSLRYNKLQELGITEDDIKKNLLFTTDKIGDLMEIALTPEDAKNWFGTTPPDLSVIARAKSTTMGPSGVDYIYSFLRAYYRDNQRKTGWNNAVFPNTAMPHVLWQLQGPVEYTEVKTQPISNDDGQTEWVRTKTTWDYNGFSETSTETLANYRGSAKVENIFKPADAEKAAAFDNDVADLANFLGWMAEPNQLFRKKLGVWVLIFLGIFFVAAWRLNAAYWKHVK